MDQDFEAFIKTRFPGGASAWDNVEPRAKSTFLNSQWEHHIKSDFDNTEWTWNVDLPVRGDNGQLEIHS